MENFVGSKLMFIALICLLIVVKTQGQWQSGHATCYQNARGAACGYNANWQGYGDKISAVSAALFGGTNGAQCGACYEILCAHSSNCIRGAGSIKVTVTDFCPSTSGPDPWCNTPNKHFDLSIPMFTKLAPYKAGIVPVYFRRVRCEKKTGGVRFTINVKTNPYWLEVLVSNVGGNGVVTAVHVKGSRTGWMAMRRNWGQNWDADSSLYGQSLSFQVTTSDGNLLFNNVVSAGWRNGQTFEGRLNF